MRELISVARVSASSELLPEPDTPTSMVALRSGRTTSTDFRLLVRAPTISIPSVMGPRVPGRHGERRRVSNRNPLGNREKLPSRDLSSAMSCGSKAEVCRRIAGRKDVATDIAARSTPAMPCSTAWSERLDRRSAALIVSG